MRNRTHYSVITGNYGSALTPLGHCDSWDCHPQMAYYCYNFCCRFWRQHYSIHVSVRVSIYWFMMYSILLLPNCILAAYKFRLIISTKTVEELVRKLYSCLYDKRMVMYWFMMYSIRLRPNCILAAYKFRMGNYRCWIYKRYYFYREYQHYSIHIFNIM